MALNSRQQFRRWTSENHEPKRTYALLTRHQGWLVPPTSLELLLVESNKGRTNALLLRAFRRGTQYGFISTSRCERVDPRYSLPDGKQHRMLTAHVVGAVKSPFAGAFAMRRKGDTYYVTVEGKLLYTIPRGQFSPQRAELPRLVLHADGKLPSEGEEVAYGTVAENEALFTARSGCQLQQAIYVEGEPSMVPTGKLVDGSLYASVLNELLIQHAEEERSTMLPDVRLFTAFRLRDAHVLGANPELPTGDGPFRSWLGHVLTTRPHIEILSMHTGRVAHVKEGMIQLEKGLQEIPKVAKPLVTWSDKVRAGQPIAVVDNEDIAKADFADRQLITAAILMLAAVPHVDGKVLLPRTLIREVEHFAVRRRKDNLPETYADLQELADYERTLLDQEGKPTDLRVFQLPSTSAFNVGELTVDLKILRPGKSERRSQPGRRRKAMARA